MWHVLSHSAHPWGLNHSACLAYRCSQTAHYQLDQCCWWDIIGIWCDNQGNEKLRMRCPARQWSSFETMLSNGVNIATIFLITFQSKKLVGIWGSFFAGHTTFCSTWWVLEAYRPSRQTTWGHGMVAFTSSHLSWESWHWINTGALCGWY